MTAPTDFIWRAAGRPEPSGPAAKRIEDRPADCVMCGEHRGRTADANRALGNNFTDHYLFARPDSDRVCVGCIWVTSGRPPASLRMWSIIVAPGVDLPRSHEKAWIDLDGLCLTNRADPAPIIDILADPPATEWLVTVAVSAQKHVAPYAQVNRGGGAWTVRMEGVDVTGTPAEWRTVLGHAATLRADGHRPDDIAAGQPTLSRIRTASDLEWWRTNAEPLAAYLRSPLLELALWCSTKGTINDYTHRRPEGLAGRVPAGSDRPVGPGAGSAAQLSLY